MRKLLSRIVVALVMLAMAAPATMARTQRIAPKTTELTELKGDFQKEVAVRAKKFSKNQGNFVSKKNAPIKGLHKPGPMLVTGSANFYGSLMYADSQTSDAEYGIYSFTGKSPAVASQVASIESMYFNGGATPIGDNQYMGVYTYGGTTLTQIYDMTNWTFVDQHYADDMYARSLDMTYDPVSEKVYGAFVGMGDDGKLNWFFSTYDYASRTTTKIGNTALADPYFGIAANGKGEIYAITESGVFGKVNKSTGAFTVIANTGLESAYLTSAAIDPESNLFYYIQCPEEGISVLYAIDPANGHATTVYEMPDNEEVCGLYFNNVNAEAAAPGLGKINNITFEGVSLNGTITFETPANYFDGTAPAKGETLSYEVRANDQVVASGAGLEYGDSYTVNFSVPATGLYKIDVVFFNAAGASPALTRTKFIGVDTPLAPADVVASWNAGVMTIDWSAVTEGMNEGGIDTANVTYAVYTVGRDLLLKEALTATSFSFNLEEPAEYTTYQYYVIATADGLESAPAYSNTVGLGAIVPPFATEFTEGGDGWTIVNANDDAQTWQFDETNGALIYYNSSMDMDDWLISPAMKLQAGFQYTITVEARCASSTWPEKFEIMCGTSTDPIDMTETVMAATTVTNTAFAPYTTSFVASADGKFYFGIHGISDADQFALYVKNFSISAAINPKAPAAPELDIVVPYDGKAYATINWTNPTLAVDGSDLTEITKVEVYVNDKIVATSNATAEKAIEPGSAEFYEYAAPDNDTYTFKVIAYNQYGAGIAAVRTRFVGINIPAMPANVVMTEITDGVVDITWDKVTTDIDGNVMNPDLVTYTVFQVNYADGEWTADLVASELKANEILGYQALPEGEQNFIYFAVVSESSTGWNEDYGYSNFEAVGTPVKTPFSDNFNGTCALPWYVDDYNGYNLVAEFGDVDVTLDGEPFTSRTRDGGFLAFSMYKGTYSSIESGKIAIDSENPILQYYYYNYAASSRDYIYTIVITDEGAEYVDVTTCGTGNVGEWNRRMIDFSAYAGKTVSVAIMIRANNVGIALLDDLYIGTAYEKDMEAVAMTVPSAKVTAQSEFTIGYKIRNLGSVDATDYVLNLYADGDLVESVTNVPDLAAGAEYEGEFSALAYDIFETGKYEFNYVIEYAGDKDLGNNSTAAQTVEIVNNNFPEIELEGALDGEKVTLSWEDPAINVTEEDIYESFESEDYPVFTTESFGPWTLKNYNNAPTYGLQNHDMLDVNYPNEYSAFGWMLFDPNADGLDVRLDDAEIYGGYNSNTCLMAMAHTDGANDAWVISPYLSGAGQTVTFMAKCATLQYGKETIEALYSTTGTDKQDFTALTIQNYNANDGLTTTWTEYSFTLPAGTKYFAIRSTSDDRFVTQIDCIEYHYASPFIDLELTGYNVYRNGELISKEPVSSNTYEDTVTAEGTYEYTVTAVYNNGESAPSNIVSIEYTGIADAAMVKSSVKVVDQCIVVLGAEKAMISAADGKVVYNGKDANVKVAVAPGVYVVATNDQTTKVIVK